MREVVRVALAEADAGIERDARRASMPAAAQAVQPRREVIVDVQRRIAVWRILLHGARLALHMHEDDRGAALGDDPQAVGIAGQRGHVVDDAGARIDAPPA